MGKKKSKTQKSKQKARKRQNKQEPTKVVTLRVPNKQEDDKKNTSIPKKDLDRSPKKNLASEQKKVEPLFKREKTILPSIKEKAKVEKIKKKHNNLSPQANKESLSSSKDKITLSSVFKKIKEKSYLSFNFLLVFSYLCLFIALLLVGVFNWKIILFTLGLLLFLLLIALSYTKYISGKIFSFILVIMMSFFTYKLQYTYDFIHGLNKTKYEAKTYYIVTFDTSINKSVYVLNNKKIGLLTTNINNVERKLNTKLDNITYISYDNINDLVFSFYNQEFRAIVVNENQYKFLENSNYDREVKILYEFQAIGLKENT